jgi:hypothetical protein
LHIVHNYFNKKENPRPVVPELPTLVEIRVSLTVRNLLFVNSGAYSEFVKVNREAV